MIEGYRAIKETAELWDITRRLLQVLYSEGRVECSVKFGREWTIPMDARVASGRYKGVEKEYKRR